MITHAEDGGAVTGTTTPPAQAAGSPHHIVAASSPADERTRVLKHGDMFAVFDHYGDIKPGGLGEEGLYHEGTRYLSCFVLDMEGGRPFFLSSTVRHENDQLAVTLTNPDLLRASPRTIDSRGTGTDMGVRVTLGTLHLALKKFLWQRACYQQLRIKNHGLEPVATNLTLHFAADFADIFEVRGMNERAGARTWRRKSPTSASGSATGARTDSCAAPCSSSSRGRPSSAPPPRAWTCTCALRRKSSSR
jgi:glycogen debranching enzyme